MKTIFLHCCLWACCQLGFAQQIPTTLYASDHYNTLVVFPSAIKQAVAGSDDFLFSYNTDQPQKFGLLKGRPGKESNLIVITGEGTIYSFVLKYRDSLARFNYVVSADDQLKKPAMPKPAKMPGIEASKMNSKANQDHLKMLCSYYLNNMKGNLRTTRNHGLLLKVREVVHREGKVFVLVELRNHSKIDLDISTIDLFMLKGNRTKKCLLSENPFEPLFYLRPSFHTKKWN